MAHDGTDKHLEAQPLSRPPCVGHGLAVDARRGKYLGLERTREGLCCVAELFGGRSRVCVERPGGVIPVSRDDDPERFWREVASEALGEEAVHGEAGIEGVAADHASRSRPAVEGAQVYVRAYHVGGHGCSSLTPKQSLGYVPS